jgi:alkyl hydroperoxide reductase subunit F
VHLRPFYSNTMMQAHSGRLQGRLHDDVLSRRLKMLDTNMKTQLKAYLEKLTKPVELVATLDDSAKSAEIKELLAEIAELSDKSHLQRRQHACGT